MKQLFVISVTLALFLMPVVSTIAQDEGTAAGGAQVQAKETAITVKGAVSKLEAEGQVKFILTDEKGRKVELPATIGEKDKAVNVADLVGENVVLKGMGKITDEGITCTKFVGIKKAEAKGAAAEGKGAEGAAGGKAGHKGGLKK